MMTNTNEFWKVMGKGLKRPRTLTRSRMIDFAIAKGYDAAADFWAVPTNKAVAFLRDQGYSVTYFVLEDD